LKASGARCGLISTIEYRGPEGASPHDRTTPESLDLQEKLAEFVRQRCDFAVMEVSSHALALARVHATRFRTAVFTNMSQDHLDFHGTMQGYFEAKKMLFLETGVAPPLVSIINHDDLYGVQLEQICAGRCLTYSTETVADFQVTEAHTDSHGTQLHVKTPRGKLQVRTPLLGKPNQSNVLAALAVGFNLGVDDATLLRGIEACTSIPGRFERVDQGQPFSIFVDYAHTPDALEKILQTARQLKPTRLLVVFGCGGERDRGKRPQMARVAERLSDVCLVTSDNPRGEDPATILSEIEAGFQIKPVRYEIEPDRKKAIARILSLAKAGDLVLLAGKGHETHQILPEGTIHLDDREEVRRILYGMGFSG
jgi:UDP-N-acetylmuramoyl-L-alanyl-D-glutamate--2,6-diaminopimelate ligase